MLTVVSAQMDNSAFTISAQEIALEDGTFISSTGAASLVLNIDTCVAKMFIQARW